MKKNPTFMLHDKVRLKTAPHIQGVVWQVFRDDMTATKIRYLVELLNLTGHTPTGTRPVVTVDEANLEFCD